MFAAINCKTNYIDRIDRYNKCYSLNIGNFCTLSALFNQSPERCQAGTSSLVNRLLSHPGYVIAVLAHDGTVATAN